MHYKVLKMFNMDGSKKGFISMSSGANLSNTQCLVALDELESMVKIPYTSVIGSIMYAMLCTCLDVSYTLSVTSRYQANLGLMHWNVVKNILKYLRRTK